MLLFKRGDWGPMGKACEKPCCCAGAVVQEGKTKYQSTQYFLSLLVIAYKCTWFSSWILSLFIIKKLDMYVGFCLKSINLNSALYQLVFVKGTYFATNWNITLRVHIVLCLKHIMWPLRVPITKKVRYCIFHFGWK